MRTAAAVLLASLLVQLQACGGGDASPSAPSLPPAVATPPIAPAPAPAPDPCATPNPAGVPSNYRLAWSDEFDIDGLPDPTRWAFDTECNRLGWYNSEPQYYAAARFENSVVAGGRLRITARRESLGSLADWGGQRYTSARLRTRGKAAWTHGFFQVRAKPPCGRGTWPAIWMLGSGGVWPDDGEINIMEQVGSNPSRILGTVHTPLTGGSGDGSSIQLVDACTAFHDYQMHWTASEIAMGVDGVVWMKRLQRPRSGLAGCHHTRSTTIAMPWPTPMHIVHSA